jgi:uncharacterized membrane protein YcjF (UPF0283 family)
MKNLTVGLEALRRIEVERQKIIDEEKQKQLEKIAAQEKEKIEKKDRKLNRAVTLIGFLAIISAILDILNLVDWFIKSKATGWQFGVALVLVIAAVAVTVVYFIIYRRRDGE